MSPHHLQGSFLLFHFFHMPLSPLPTPHRRPLASLWAFFRSSAQELTQRSCSAPRRLLWRCGRGGTTKSGSNFDGGARLFLFSSRLALRLPLHRPRQQLFLPAPTLPLLVPNLATSEGRGGAGFLSALPCCLSSLPFSFFLLRRGGDVEHGAQSISRGGAKMVASSEPEFWVGAPRATALVVARATAACCRPVGVSSFPRPSSSSSRRLLSKSWRPRRRSPRDGVGWGGVIVAALASIAGGRRRFLPGSRRLAFLELVRRFFGEKKFRRFLGLGSWPGNDIIVPYAVFST